MTWQSYGKNFRRDCCIFAVCIAIFAETNYGVNMPILERKIMHEANTLCSHFTYTAPCHLHRHREIQIILFTQGSGKQFVGDGVADFRTGDVALIGSNVPHLHLCGTLLEGGKEQLPNIREAVQISPDLFPADMKRLPDYQELSLLLDKSRYGMRFYDEGLYEELRRQFSVLDGLQYTDRIAHTFKLLGLLAHCRDVRLIASTLSADEQADADSPVGLACTYLYEHFQEDIKLEDVASHVHMNPAALCRLFKKGTDKTLFQYLNDLRIEHACRLLAYSQLSVSQVGYEAGYSSIPYFIQQFRRKTGVTPGEYRKEVGM